MSAYPPDFDAPFFRSALGRFPTGVTLITTQNPQDHQPVGLTISSFTSVSLEPPLVSWTLTKSASSLDSFLKTKRYVIHVLSAKQLPLARKFASGSQRERFSNVALRRTPYGTLTLADSDCAARFECYNLQHHEAGDHIIFIGQVEHCEHSFHQPLVYHAGDFDLTPSQERLVGN